MQLPPHALAHCTAAQLLELNLSYNLCVSDPAVVLQVDLLSRLSAHPNIAGLHELFEDAGHKYIVMVSCQLLRFNSLSPSRLRPDSHPE